jgi:hypothetical protein
MKKLRVNEIILIEGAENKRAPSSIGKSSKGRTSDFGSLNWGSIPCFPAMKQSDLEQLKPRDPQQDIMPTIINKDWKEKFNEQFDSEEFPFKDQGILIPLLYFIESERKLAQEELLRDMYRKSAGAIIPDFIEEYAHSLGLNISNNQNK